MQRPTTNRALYLMAPVPGIERFLEYKATGKVDKKLIQDTLDRKFVGKEFNAYSTNASIARTVCYILGYKAYPEIVDDYRLSWKEDGCQNVKITYRNIAIGWIKIRKKKGRYHRNWFGNYYYDWTVSAIEIDGLDDIDAKIEEIDRICDDAKDKAAKLEREMLKLFKAIVDLSPDKTISQVQSDIEYLDKHKYRLANLLKEESERCQ